MHLDMTRDRNAYAFSTEIRVRLSETDAVGIVYFGSFSTYMDVGRMDYLNHLGLQKYGAEDTGAVPGERKLGIVRDLIPGAVVSSQLNFHNPAYYNDILVVHVRLARIGRTSYTFHFLMQNKSRPHVVATGALTLAWLDARFQPLPIPEDFRAAVRAFEGDRLEEIRP